MPLYAFGSNGSGQLGVGHQNDLSIPELVRGLRSQTVTQLAAGGNHTVIVGADGKIRATGNNEDGRACINGSSTEAFVEMPLWDYVDAELLNVKQVACSWSATYLLLADGAVFVCGSGPSGELGLGRGVVGARSPTRIPNFPPEGLQTVGIRACMGHVVAVLSNGSVYGWGKGRKGQLGKPTGDAWTPRKVDGVPFNATEVACGKDYTVILGDKSGGEMAVLGPSGSDRFGIRSNAPVLSPLMRNVASSWGSVYALREDGSIQAWGRDDRGQLPPPGLPEIVAIAAGSEHVLALTRCGKVFAWGWGEHGNCGEQVDDRGNVKSRWNEVQVPGRVTHVFAGCATSFVQTVD